MSRLLLLLVLTLFPATTTAWDMPYGVQDPLLGSAGFVNCSGGEIGYWNVIKQETPDGKRARIYMILTTKDLADPAYLICVVPPDRKVLVMEPGKQL